VARITNYIRSEALKSGALFDIAGVSNENDEWYTPSWMFHAIAVEFDLDPCSPGSPPSTVPARRHLTKAENGLTAEWEGNVWLNPPFSGKRPWYQRLVQHGTGIALMPARTETHDLQTYMEAADALLFLKGRIYFERGHRPGGNGVGGVITTPPFGVMLCAYGEEMAIALMRSKLLGVRALVEKGAAIPDMSPKLLWRPEKISAGGLPTLRAASQAKPGGEAK
jgi:DNA N-6-adenine-methyltransferase (Dam)